MHMGRPDNTSRSAPPPDEPPQRVTAPPPPLPKDTGESDICTMAVSSWNSSAAVPVLPGAASAPPAFDSDAPAFEEWSVDRITTASPARVCHMLFVRHRSGLASRIVIATGDRAKLRDVEANVHCALHTLTCASFVRLYDLDGSGGDAASSVTH